MGRRLPCPGIDLKYLTPIRCLVYNEKHGISQVKGASGEMERSIEIEVRSTEIDELGHVNNAKYLEYLEWGREDWYDRTGLGAEQLSAKNLGTVLVHLKINYRREARKGDRLHIVTRPKRKGNSSFVLKQDIVNENGQLVADAEVTVVLFDLTKRKSVPLPAEFGPIFEEAND